VEVGLIREPDPAPDPSTPISAIVPVHDRPDSVKEAVGSLLATGYPRLEIVIVDDGSGEETVSRLRELERAHGSGLRVVRHPDGGNHGPGASRNLGVRMAQGEYVCFLDSDDIVLPGRFARAVAILDADPDVDAVCEPYLKSDDRLAEEPVAVGPRGGLRETLAGPGVRWHTDSILIRRRVFLDLGGFSEALRTSEDWVLWTKLGLAGRVADGGADPVAVYRRHGNNTQPPLENSLLAFLEVLRWSRRRDLERGRLTAVRRGAWGKLLFVADRLREEGRPGRAARLLVESVAASPAFALRAAFWRNLLAAVWQAGIDR
jgi:glycosyltransferase involved in cell wall biosynthesis